MSMRPMRPAAPNTPIFIVETLPELVNFFAQQAVLSTRRESLTHPLPMGEGVCLSPPDRKTHKLPLALGRLAYSRRSSQSSRTLAKKPADCGLVFLSSLALSNSRSSSCCFL